MYKWPKVTKNTRWPNGLAVTCPLCVFCEHWLLKGETRLCNHCYRVVSWDVCITQNNLDGQHASTNQQDEGCCQVTTDRAICFSRRPKGRFQLWSGSHPTEMHVCLQLNLAACLNRWLHYLIIRSRSNDEPRHITTSISQIWSHHQIPRICLSSTKPRDWLGRTSPKWPILCRVGRKTSIRSTKTDLK